MAEDSPTKVTVRLKLPENETTPAVYANHVAVQFLGNVYILGFYAAVPSPQPPTQPIPDTFDVVAQCVARVVIPADRMENISKAIVSNLERAKTSQPKPGGDR